MIQNKDSVSIFYTLYFLFIVCFSQAGFAATNMNKGDSNVNEQIKREFLEKESSFQGTDSLHLKMYFADREYFLKLQETVSSKNQYIGLQWCIDLLSKYIEIEERKFKELNK